MTENINIDSWWSSISFLLIYFFRRDAIGAGDVKLMVAISCYLGGEMALEHSFFSLLFALGYSILTKLFKGKDTRKKIPFTPFVFLGTVAVVIKQSVFH